MIEALRGLTGQGVRVGIVDSGLQGEPFWVRQRGEDDPGWRRKEGQDLLGHGTAAASVVRFWAPDCGIEAFQVLVDHFRCSAARAQEAVAEADRIGCQIVLLSLAGAGEEGWAELLGGLRAVLVAACANDPSATGFPAALPGCLGVRASAGRRTFERLPGGLYAAPAEPPSGRGAQILMGTSCAASHLAGMAARLMEREPQLDLPGLRRRLDDLFG